MAEVRMPKMGDGMEEGTINLWLKQEGDLVTAGEPLAEIETDKANVEISAYETGVLSKIVVQVGETVPVGDVIALIGGDAALKSGGNGAAHGAGSNGGSASAETNGNAAPVVEVVTPAVAAPAVAPVVSSAAPAAVPASGLEAERVKASPLARKMAKESAIDIALVAGSGPNGRIVERDIQAFLKSGGAAASPAKAMPKVEAAPSAAGSSAAPARLAPVGPISGAASVDTKPSKMREAIAKRTVQSKQNIPHFYVTMVVEMDRALALLKELNADATDGKVTVNDIIVKSCAIALGRVPAVNATWTPDGTVRQYSEAHIGIAVGIDEGLIIPVVRNCESKSLRQISADAKGLISKARAMKLTPEEYSGGTFSVSNLGMMGVDVFTAIINPPEAAILAIGGVAREPVFTGEGDSFVVRSRMKITLSADHRLLDGVVAAKFLQEVKKSLEAPFSLLS